MKTETLKDLFLDEIKDLYDAEKQVLKATPKMAKACTDEELKQSFMEHVEQTKRQIERVEQIFELLGERPKSKPCAGMKGLIEEGREMMEEDMPGELLDIGLIGAAQRIEHYEMAGYGTARTFAQKLGMKEAVSVLQETLDEEGQTDKLLTAHSKRLLKALDRSMIEAEGSEMELESPRKSRTATGSGAGRVGRAGR